MSKDMITGLIGLFLIIVGSVATTIMYKSFADAHKEKCLTKFKTIEYEIVSNVLYCKTNDGLIKFN